MVYVLEGLCRANRNILNKIYSCEVTKSCYAHFRHPAFTYRDDDIHKVDSVNARESFGKEGSPACDVFVKLVTSLILPPSDFRLFGPMKQHVGGTRFDNIEVNMAVGDFYLNGIYKLVPR
jgi:hypothetical protein